EEREVDVRDRVRRRDLVVERDVRVSAAGASAPAAGERGRGEHEQGEREQAEEASGPGHRVPPPPIEAAPRPSRNALAEGPRRGRAFGPGLRNRKRLLAAPDRNAPKRRSLARLLRPRALSSTDRAPASGAGDRGSIPLGRTS